MSSAQTPQVFSDQQAMALAIQESQRGLGHVSPNPAVGCVILDRENHLLAKGYHQKFGGPHAEVNALRGLSPEQLQGARLFVTLEPCAHAGKTPSCAKMLATLPVAEVIYGLQDPNPLVAGKGIEILRQAGLRTTDFVHSLPAEEQQQWTDDLEQACEHFLMNYREQRPFVSLKVASSLDGQMALKTGESKWITGPSAREYGHFLRATHDVILVGRQTVLIDNPKLDVRHPDFPDHRNKVVIFDRQAQCVQQPNLQVFAAHQPHEIFVVCTSQTKSALEQDPQRLNPLGVQLLAWESNLCNLLTLLWRSGVKSILVEGGAQTLSSFISQNQADRLYLFQAPILLGGKSGKSWSEGVMIANMDQQIPLTSLRTEKVGKDILHTGRLLRQ